MKRTVDTLLDFYVDPYFRVAYKHEDVKSTSEPPNGSTSIIIRTIRECSALAEKHLEKSLEAKWSSIETATTVSIENLMNDSNYSDVLPLKTMGILPLFTVSYLAEILDDYGNDVELAKRILKLRAYAIAIRRVFHAIYAEDSDKIKGVRKADTLHPFLLYHCMRSITGFGELLAYSHSQGLAGEIAVFWKNLKNKALLSEAITKRKASALSVDEENYIEDNDWNSFNQAISELESSSFQNSVTFRRLRNYIEDKAASEGLAQLARKSQSSGPEMDASALAFCIGILAEVDKHAYSHTIVQGIKIVLESCSNGQWQTAMPFHFDDKGRGIFVPSVEIANIILRSYLGLIDEKKRIPEVAFLVAQTDQIQRHLCDHYNSLEIFRDKFKADAINIHGWCTDKAPSYSRIDSWVTISALGFLLYRIDLIRLAKKEAILKKYSWVAHSECKPRWQDIVDPDLGLGPADESIKTNLERALLTKIYEREKAPMFILYGPPGTAKTTLIQGLANRLKWDLVTLSPSDFIANGIDKIEAYSREIFSDLMNLDECIILMDEMDSLFRDRETIRGSPIEYVVPAFLPKLQKLRDYVLEHHLAVFVVTNYFESIDSAIVRGGRFDYHFLILPYSLEAKYKIIQKFLRNGWIQDNDLSAKAKEILKKLFTEHFPILVYRELEQLGKLLVNKAADPGTMTEKDLNEIEIYPSINTELYKTGTRAKAYREVCGLLDRINNGKTCDYSSMTWPEAQTFINGWGNALIKKYKDEWNKFKVEWANLIGKENKV